MWYLRASNELLSLGVTKSKFDEAVFFWHSNSILEGVIASHVDDFLWSGSDKFKDKIIQKLTNTFKISSEMQVSSISVWIYGRWLMVYSSTKRDILKNPRS